jgi:predicted ATPase
VDRPHVTAVSLRRLGRDESDHLVRGIIGNAATVSSEVIDEIVTRTDGVPLFLEEITKAVLENAAVGAIPAMSATVPATLYASLMARLDRLGPMAKEIVQQSASCYTTDSPAAPLGHLGAVHKRVRHGNRKCDD